MKDKFIKNGVFSLEYDKETLRDMVLELQEENKKLKAEYGTKAQVERDLLKEENQKLKENWNKLKEYMIKEQARIVIENTDEDEFVYTDLLNKMQEMEKNYGNVEDNT